MTNNLICEFCGLEFSRSNGKTRHQNVCEKRTVEDRKNYFDALIHQRNPHRINKQLMWTDERKRKHRDSMKHVVLKHPESYNSSNVNGRTPRILFNDSNGNRVKLSGSWELLVAEKLTQLEIRWTSVKEGFDYSWNNSTHKYFPDFYLPDHNCYIEVKGFQRERDVCKWAAFPEKLIVLKSAEIKMLIKGTFNLQTLVL